MSDNRPESGEIGPDSGEISEGLLWSLKRLGDQYGPLGVARAATELVGHGWKLTGPDLADLLRSALRILEGEPVVMDPTPNYSLRQPTTPENYIARYFRSGHPFREVTVKDGAVVDDREIE
jgi:hypothetical protein